MRAPPFRPGALQPFVKLLAGFATTPTSTVTTASTYGANADTTRTLIIYQDYGWKTWRPLFGIGAGVNTQAFSGIQVVLDVRETFIAQSIVMGPTTTQNQEPPHRSVIKGIPAVRVGLELVLKREHGKRY